MSNDYTEIVETRGEYRATITLDLYPSEPENETGCPVLRVDEWNRVDDTGYGNLSAKGDGLPLDAAYALRRCLDNNGNTSDAVDVFARWLRIWHGGDAVGYHLGYSREYGYVAYTTRAMALNVWGHTEDTLNEHPEYLVPELSEWEGWCEGECYLAEVERAVKMNTTTTTLDGQYLNETCVEDWVTEEGPVGGYYSSEWASEAALEMLDAYAPKVVTA